MMTLSRKQQRLLDQIADVLMKPARKKQPPKKSKPKKRSVNSHA